MAKNKWTKIMAFLALFWIIIWIVWTWVLMIFSNNNTNEQQTLTQEQYIELQKLIEAQSWVILDENIETLSWETE
jgi:preprotein translocase subunit SecG